MVAIIDFRKYPFLKPLEEELKKYKGGLSFEKILTSDNYILQEAKKRVVAINTDAELTPYYRLIEPVLVFYTALYLVKLSQNELLKIKFVKKEAELFRNSLDSENEENLLAIAHDLGIHILPENAMIERKVGRKTFAIQYRFSITIDKFLKYLISIEDKLDSLITDPDHIKVFLTKPMLVDILTIRIKELLYEMIYKADKSINMR